MNSKKGVSSRVFVYAMAVVVIAFVLIFGLRAIGKIKETAVKAEMTMFINNMKNSVKENSFYGRKSFEEFTTPSGYSTIVFVSSNDIAGSDLLDEYPLAQEVAVSSDNAFLVDDEGSIKPFSVGDISISPYLPEKYGTVYGTDAAVFRSRQGRFVIPMVGTGDNTCIGTDLGTEVCDDGMDNDCDKEVDCDDNDCSAGGTEVKCDDGMDNDCDGDIDCNDNDCNDNIYCGGTISCFADDTSSVEITADNVYRLYVNGNIIAEDNNWKTSSTYEITNFHSGSNTIAIEAIDDRETPSRDRWGLLAKFTCGGVEVITQPGSYGWKCIFKQKDEINPAGWNDVGFDDSAWPAAVAPHDPTRPNVIFDWRLVRPPIEGAEWIWGPPPPGVSEYDKMNECRVLCRINIVLI